MLNAGLAAEPGTVRRLGEPNVMSVAGRTLALVIVATCAAAESAPAVDLAKRAQEVVAANPREHLAAFAEVVSVSADGDPLSFSRVRLLEVIGQEVTKAAVAHSGEVQLLLVGLLADRADLRAGGQGRGEAKESARCLTTASTRRCGRSRHAFDDNEAIGGNANDEENLPDCDRLHPALHTATELAR
jgi:hypothetical protein